MVPSFDIDRDLQQRYTKLGRYILLGRLNGECLEGLGMSLEKLAHTFQLRPLSCGIKVYLLVSRYRGAIHSFGSCVRCRANDDSVSMEEN
jgi:hypothetical protein